MDGPRVSSYHLGGYIRIGEQEKGIIAVACFSAYIGEQFIMDHFSDDRLLRCSDEYWSNLMDEAQYVARVLPQCCFTRVLNTLGLNTDYDVFRDFVVQSLHASLAYLHMSTFDQLERFPLKVCKGDLGLHVAELPCWTTTRLIDLVCSPKKCGGLLKTASACLDSRRASRC